MRFLNQSFLDRFGVLDLYVRVHVNCFLFTFYSNLSTRTTYLKQKISLSLFTNSIFIYPQFHENSTLILGSLRFSWNKIRFFKNLRADPRAPSNSIFSLMLRSCLFIPKKLKSAFFYFAFSTDQPLSTNFL